MYRPIRPNLTRKARIKSLPAPVGGLNARDAYAEMPESDAVVLENMFPMPSYVIPRKGSTTWATNLPGAVDTLATYSPPSGVRKLFAFSGGNVYDVTAGGPVGAAVVTGNNSAWWQFVNFGAGGGQYLVAVNGSDSMLIYSATGGWQRVTDTSIPITLTGVTTSLLANVNVYMGRLFFIEKNSMRAWYLPLNSVGGTANSLDMSQFTQLGGSLISMATWTLQTSDGSTQLATFITSEGEIITFQGNDPSNASTWTLVGSFRIGRPVGYRCQAKLGSDIGILCADGLIPLSKAALTDRQTRAIAISDKIVNLINADVQTFTGTTGWQVLLYPIGNKLIVNVPDPTGSYQYVMNTINNSWTVFTGWKANCFALMGDNLYYGANGSVVQCDTGLNDDGTAVQCKAIQAPTYCGSHEQKMLSAVRPVFVSNGPITAKVAMCPDFYFTTPTDLTNFISAFFAYWNPPWNTPWSATQQVYKTWTPTSGIGYSAAISVAIANYSATIQWQASDIDFQQGGPL